jgi:hypothetical protein
MRLAETIKVTSPMTEYKKAKTKTKKTYSDAVKKHGKSNF